MAENWLVSLQARKKLISNFQYGGKRYTRWTRQRSMLSTKMDFSQLHFSVDSLSFSQLAIFEFHFACVKTSLSAKSFIWKCFHASQPRLHMKRFERSRVLKQRQKGLSAGLHIRHALFAPIFQNNGWMYPSLVYSNEIVKSSRKFGSITLNIGLFQILKFSATNFEYREVSFSEWYTCTTKSYSSQKMFYIQRYRAYEVLDTIPQKTEFFNEFSILLHRLQNTCDANFVGEGINC